MEINIFGSFLANTHRRDNNFGNREEKESDTILGLSGNRIRRRHVERRKGRKFCSCVVHVLMEPSGGGAGFLQWCDVDVSSTCDRIGWRAMPSDRRAR